MIVNKFKVSLIDVLKQIKAKKKSNEDPNLASLFDLEDGLKFCDIVFSQRQMEYLMLINFKLCKEVKWVAFNELLNSFKVM